MNAKQFQELLKESEGILRDEDFAPKGAEEITRERMSYDSHAGVDSLLEDLIASAEEIIERVKECQQAMNDGDYAKDIEDLESVVQGATQDLDTTMQDILMAVGDNEEDEEDDEYMRESKETK